MTQIVPKKLLLLASSAAMLTLNTSALAQVQTRMCVEHWLPLSNAYLEKNEIEEMLRGSPGVIEQIFERSENTKLEIKTVSEALQRLPNNPDLQTRLKALQARLESYAKTQQNKTEAVMSRHAAARSIERLELKYYNCMARSGFANLRVKYDEQQMVSPDEALADAQQPPAP